MEISIANNKQLNSIKWENVTYDDRTINKKLDSDRIYITIHHLILKKKSSKLKIRFYLGKDILDLFNFKLNDKLSVQISPDGKLIRITKSISTVGFLIQIPKNKNTKKEIKGRTPYINCRINSKYNYSEQKKNTEVMFELFDNKTILINMTDFIKGKNDE
jgi:hypothetical protein